MPIYYNETLASSHKSASKDEVKVVEGIRLLCNTNGATSRMSLSVLLGPFLYIPVHVKEDQCLYMDRNILEIPFGSITHCPIN